MALVGVFELCPYRRFKGGGTESLLSNAGINRTIA